MDVLDILKYGHLTVVSTVKDLSAGQSHIRMSVEKGYRLSLAKKLEDNHGRNRRISNRAFCIIGRPTG